MFGNKANGDQGHEERDERIKRLREEKDRLKAIEREQEIRLK